MSIKSFVVALQDRIEARRRYRKAIAEIEAMTQSDLIDLGVFEVDLRHAARRAMLG